MPRPNSEVMSCLVCNNQQTFHKNVFLGVVVGVIQPVFFMSFTSNTRPSDDQENQRCVAYV